MLRKINFKKKNFCDNSTGSGEKSWLILKKKIINEIFENLLISLAESFQQTSLFYFKLSYNLKSRNKMKKYMLSWNQKKKQHVLSSQKQITACCLQIHFEAVKDKKN